MSRPTQREIQQAMRKLDRLSQDLERMGIGIKKAGQDLRQLSKRPKKIRAKDRLFVRER